MNVPLLLRRLLLAALPAPVPVVCGRCGLRVALGCWHGECPVFPRREGARR